MASFEEVRARAQTLLSTVRWVRQQLAVVPTPAAAAVNSVISQAGRDLAAAIGGSLSEYITGRRRYGSRAARAAVDQGRRRGRANLQAQKRQQVIALLDQTSILISEINDPIDWRIRRRLALAATRARTLQRWSTILDRVETVLLELTVYSPPDDDISVVRGLDAGFRQLIETRLSALDPSWWHTRVPSPISRRAEVEAQRRSEGRLPPLQFLRFSDYGKIILLPSNWEETFGAFLGDEDTFLSRFTDLKVLRNDVAHSRTLSAADRIRLRQLAASIFPPSSG